MSFANDIYTPEGGMHLEGFRRRAHPRDQRLRAQAEPAQGKDANLTGDDMREGLSAVISGQAARPAV